MKDPIVAGAVLWVWLMAHTCGQSCVRTANCDNNQILELQDIA